ncbi:DUF2000 domain-containing protein [Streptomonospora salina]|uniref:DUF2000 domain-containing protein n=1 Tax=Streptomonospora salina TaxID=104205 RepID=A0A841E5S4_9ACTN|nr:DUF2000 domain-containing protein [Streptomonospora salina]MBB5996503.1 hypothetical protein [Streptomonospora salina]
MVDTPTGAIGFAPDEVATGEPTRSARLKWVVVVEEGTPPGRAANAAVCVAAATAQGVSGLLGPDAEDAGGSLHPGLPWAGCTILSATGARLAALRSRAAASDGVHVVDMPAAAQRTRVYDVYLQHVAATPGTELDYSAVSLVGPRNRISTMVHGLPLLT